MSGVEIFQSKAFSFFSILLKEIKLGKHSEISTRKWKGYNKKKSHTCVALSDSMLSICVMANSQRVHWGPSFTFKVCAENMPNIFVIRHVFLCLSSLKQVVYSIVLFF